MAHTYASSDCDNYKTTGFNEGQMQQAMKSTTKNYEIFSNIYPESSTDVDKRNELPQGGDTSNTDKTVQDSKTDTTQSSDTRLESFLKRRKFIIILVCVVVFLLVFGLVFGILYFTKDQNAAEETQQTQTTKPPLGTFPNPARSCVELRDVGFRDGIYVIQPSLQPFEAYCDMTAAGGGWVLAATINEHNFNSTKTFGGSWFLMTSNNHQNVLDYQNWMNTKSFGTLNSSTKTDYKGQAYFEYQGNDVMLRHVPNHTPLEVSREQSLLQYQTENGFMQKYGGNLHKLFNYHYPLKPRNSFYPDVNSMLDRLTARATEITNIISDFYFYDYGSDTNVLSDNELFPGNFKYGMVILMSASQYCYPKSYATNCPSDYVDYGLDFRCDLGNMMGSSRKSHPFFALYAVGNFDHCFDDFFFRVHANRPNPDLTAVYTGNHILNNFFMQYDARCRYGTTYASFCDVWFYVINDEKWKSSGKPTMDSHEFSYSNHYKFVWSNSEPVSNTLFGYTMISRKNGLLINETEIKATTYKILEIISETQQFCSDCFYDDDVLAVPVQFSIGNDSVVDSMLPPSVKPLPIGFIQFRAYGSTGSVYAMCPAVRVNDWRSRYVCIGGMKNPNSSYTDDCNDFTNWNGLPGTSLNDTTPIDFAHSKKDLDSTIMIFYR